MARIVNPYNLDVEDDDALFAGALCQGLIWIEDDDEYERQPEFADVILVNGTVTRTLKGHKGSVNSLEVSGSSLISASTDGTLCVWNWETGLLLHSLTGHAGSINSVAINGDFAFTASSDKTLRVWNWRLGQHVQTLTGCIHGLSTLDIDGDVVVGASFGEVWIWNWQTGEHLQTLRNTWNSSGHHESGVSLVAIDGEKVLSYSSQPDIFIVRNWKTGERLHHLHMDYLVDEECSIVVTGSIVVIVDDNNPDIFLWDWKSGQQLNKQHNPTNSTDNIVFLTTYGVCSFFNNGKWSRYNLDAKAGHVGIFRFVGDRSHVVRGGHDGNIQIIRVEPFLRNLIADNTKPIADHKIDAILTEVRDFIRERKEEWVNFSRVEQHIHNSFPQLDLQQLEGTAKKYKHLRKLIEDYPQRFVLRPDEHKSGLFYIHNIADYRIDDILVQIREYIRGCSEEWVNLTRVSQHFREVFSNLNVKSRGTSDKKYKSFRQLLEDYPHDFELRLDPKKQGLYWIRLKQPS